MTTESRPKFFKAAAELRAWLEKHHQRADECWIGFYKKATGKPSLTWQEVVDESLCFGWIDGIRKSIDADSFKQRITPRRARSIWSRVNIARVAVLTAEGRMRPAGLAAFEKRDVTRVYSYEQREAGLDPTYLSLMKKKNRKAWDFLHSQPPGYQRLAGWFVMSAKKEETRLRRLDRLIADSAAGRRLGMLNQDRKKTPPSRG